ncbi:MAG: LAGLIDADG family homing endonuclease [Candidatus Woesearchaeota archaeon]
MYKTHTLEEYEEVMRLRKLGLGPTNIFSILSKQGLNISYGALYDWIHTTKRPFQDKVLSKISKQSKFLTEEKAYILGVLCGDGYTRVDKLGHFLVGLDVCDEDFGDEFRKCLKKVYGLVPSKKKRITKSTNYSKNPKPRYVINLTSKLVVNDLLKYSKSFKTFEWEVPEEILKSETKIKSAFLRGLFDSEGAASLKIPYGVYLSVCSGNIDPLLKIKEILKKDFDIDLSVGYDRSVIKLKSAGYKNVKTFYDKINFTIKRKQEKLEKGLLTYKRKGVRRYPLEFKRKALELLEKYKDPCFVADLVGTHNANIYDWKNGRYMR